MSYTTLTDTDDIDLVLTLNPHGWSTCWVFVAGKSYELTITHVFNEPYEEFIRALIRLLNGQKTTAFFWYAEPGGQQITLTRLDSQPDAVLVDVQGFDGDIYEEPKDFERTVAFEIKLRSLLILCYTQLKKTFLLLQERSYTKNRGGDFPFHEFAAFEKAVLTFLRLEA